MAGRRRRRTRTRQELLIAESRLRLFDLQVASSRRARDDLHGAGGPSDLDPTNLFGLSESEGHARVARGQIAVSRLHLAPLPREIRLERHFRADALPVGFGS